MKVKLKRYKNIIIYRYFFFIFPPFGKTKKIMAYLPNISYLFHFWLEILKEFI